MEPHTLEKLKTIRARLVERFDSLSLFVVIKRGDANLWDFVFAGEKLDNPNNLKQIAEIVRNGLDTNEVVRVARLVLLNSDDPFVKDFNATFSVGNENGCVVIKDGQINNIQIKEAYLFFSKS